ncbi:MAG: ABC transporter permease [Desulfobacterales bacterium]|nr:ABC transporter permease [Desulfobacterales bacterium]
MSRADRALEVFRWKRILYDLKEAWKRFRKGKSSIMGLVIVSFIIGMSVFAPLIAPHEPDALFYGDELKSPSAKFLMGTDRIGRDIFSYIVWGGRVSLFVAGGAVLIETIIALIIGGWAGYFGGLFDEIVMRFTDVIMTLPTIVILLVAVSMFRVRSIVLVTTIMGLLSWPWMTRIIRTQFLSLKEAPFVEAAKSMGASNIRIIFRYIFPNALSPIIVIATLDSAFFILYEATLAFLGLVDPTAISWGVMVATGKTVLRRAPWVTSFPSLMIFLTTLGFNLLGDGLRDYLDVKI